MGNFTCWCHFAALVKLWQGRGIDKLFQNSYGEKAVKHMLSGKADARANRAYILTESALLIKLQQIALSESAASTNNVNLEVIQKLYKPVLSKEADIDPDIREMQALRTILESQKIALQEKPQTERL